MHRKCAERREDNVNSATSNGKGLNGHFPSVHRVDSRFLYGYKR